MPNRSPHRNPKSLGNAQLSYAFRPQIRPLDSAKTLIFRREQLQGVSTHMKTKYVQLACMLVLAIGALAIRSVPLLATSAGYASSARNLYAVDQSSKNRGSISIYDIDAGHRLIKTIHTIPDVGDVRGVAVSAVTGKLYVAYRNIAGVGM